MLQNNVLVTGASGFTGAWLTKELLQSGAEVTTLLVEDPNPDSVYASEGLAQHVREVRGSILDFEALATIIADSRIDSVFHLAGLAVENGAYEHARHSFETNIRDTYNVLEACRLNADRVTKVFVASSDKVYGDSPALPYLEELALQGMNPYGVSKCCADMIARSYYHSYKLPVTVARFANVYGGGDLNWSRLVPNTIRRLFMGKCPVIRTPSHGVYKRDFLFIKEPGIVLNYAAWDEITDDIDDASIYGGIQFRFDQEAGAHQGSHVGAYILRNYLRSLDDSDDSEDDE